MMEEKMIKNWFFVDFVKVKGEEAFKTKVIYDDYTFEHMFYKNIIKEEEGQKINCIRRVRVEDEKDMEVIPITEEERYFITTPPVQAKWECVPKDKVDNKIFYGGNWLKAYDLEPRGIWHYYGTEAFKKKGARLSWNL